MFLKRHSLDGMGNVQTYPTSVSGVTQVQDSSQQVKQGSVYYPLVYYRVDKDGMTFPDLMSAANHLAQLNYVAPAAPKAELTPQKTTDAPAVVSRSEYVPTYNAIAYDSGGGVVVPGGTDYQLLKNSTGAANTAANPTTPDISVPSGVAYSDAVSTTPDAPAVAPANAPTSPSAPWALIVALASAMFLN